MSFRNLANGRQLLSLFRGLGAIATSAPGTKVSIEQEVLQTLDGWLRELPQTSRDRELLHNHRIGDAPIKATGSVRVASLSWRPAQDVWDLELCAWIEPSEAGRPVKRRSVTWTAEWRQLPSDVREHIIQTREERGQKDIIRAVAAPKETR